MRSNRFTFPFIMPLLAFAVAIAAGTALLWLDGIKSGNGGESLWDAIFMATSSVCVTGLASIDFTQAYSRLGQSVMLGLMQLGGLGITTYTTLIFFLLARRVSLRDRISLGQALMHNKSFHLGFFLRRVILVVLTLEICGAFLLYMMEPERIGPFRAVFLSVSSFCNAGFAPWSDNLTGWQQHTGVNCVVMSLIIMGGLGFAVLDECIRLLKAGLRSLLSRVAGREAPPVQPLSFQAKLVLSTSTGLILTGAIFIFALELFASGSSFAFKKTAILPAVFQSMTARTAGFNTLDIGKLTDTTLLTIIVLMFVGGSSGSCAGGIKTGTFRVLLAFGKSALKGNNQVTLAKKGVSKETLNNALVLFLFAILLVVCSTFILTLTESRVTLPDSAPRQALDYFFESVSALATVGLSTGVTPHLSDAGKIMLSLIMFVGRLGPIWLITAIHQFQEEAAYRLPEKDILIG